MLAAIVIITAVRSTFLFLQSVESNRIVLRITADLQARPSATSSTPTMRASPAKTPGRLMSRLTNDVGFIQQAVQSSMNTLVRDSLSVVALLGSMLYLDWLISLIVLGVYPLAIVPIATIARRIRKTSTQAQNELGSMTSLLAEKLGAPVSSRPSASKTMRLPGSRAASSRCSVTA